VYHWENVLALRKGIQYDMHCAGMPQQKVHFVSADGGFDAQRDNECQEAIAQKLVLCQVAAGLHLLRNGGTLLVKMFGFQTTTVRTAMRHLYDSFDEIVVLKPISSRPASSERYVVCTGFRGVPQGWDGPKWMNSVLLGMAPNRDEAHYWQLDRYLDDVDRDIFTLNLKACFAILSCLDRRTAATQVWNQENDGWYSEPPQLDVEVYKHAWRLN
jgi:cap1 methyltransferase